MKKILLSIVGAGLISSSTCFAESSVSGNFDKEMINVQKKMISKNKKFSVDDVKIIEKKKIDKRWQMFTFDIALTEKKNNSKFNTPMIIFTDGTYQTNSLMNISTGVRYEDEERARMQKANQTKEEKEKFAFESTFVLDKKYYNKEHLISGDMNAKNKVVLISDPLCVACISTFPSMYNQIKNKKDYAFFYYHFPLKGLHPTAETISKAMVVAKKAGIKEVELKTYEANFSKIYDVYREKDNAIALQHFNKALGTKITMAQLDSVSVDDDMKIGQDVKLTGTPTVVFNGSLKNSRNKLVESLEW